MTTDEIIRELRAKAGVEGKSTLGSLLEQAADRLEELDERVAIMMEGNIAYDTETTNEGDEL
ncbi:MAG: hypothetical protein IKM73_08685 [Acidaminococcaceae bacterium]|nr:hypothetical protein [Acidaminococcaceae bacterium]